MPEHNRTRKHPAEHIIQLSRLPVPEYIHRSRQERALGDSMMILNAAFLRGAPRAHETTQEGLLRLGFVKRSRAAAGKP